MKKPGRGTNGHIAIGCNNVDRAIYHLSQRGAKFDLDSKVVKNGKTIACYLQTRSAASHSTWFRPEPGSPILKALLRRGCPAAEGT